MFNLKEEIAYPVHENISINTYVWLADLLCLLTCLFVGWDTVSNRGYWSNYFL